MKTGISLLVVAVIFAATITTIITTIVDNRLAYIEACELMGGSALIGKMGTKICVKNENLIVSE